MNTLHKVSVVIVAYNEAARLKYMLPYIKQFFGEVIVGVQKSIDDTYEIASEFADVVIPNLPNIGYPEPHRNLCFDVAGNEWVLILDADELPSERFISECDELMKAGFDGYYLPRRNTVDGIEPLYGSFNVVEWKKYRFGKIDSFKLSVKIHDEILPKTIKNKKALDYICIYHDKSQEEQDFDINNYKEKAYQGLINQEWMRKYGHKLFNGELNATEKMFKRGQTWVEVGGKWDLLHRTQRKEKGN
jgi:glycosyltransferase involved in cell wall biosynthesis